MHNARRPGKVGFGVVPAVAYRACSLSRFVGLTLAFRERGHGLLSDARTRRSRWPAGPLAFDQPWGSYKMKGPDSD